MAEEVEFRSGGNQFAAALADIARSLRHPSIWLLMAAHESLGRRRLANLGALWVPISVAIFVAGVGYIFSALMRKPFEFYVPYLASGTLIWRFIVGVTGEASSVFSAKRNYIESVHLPLSTYVFQMVTKHLILMLLAAPVYVVVAIYFKVQVNMELALLVPAVLIYALTAVGLTFFLGILSLRMPDIGQAIASILPLFFLMTPVIWIAEGDSIRVRLSQFNPFYHMLEISRDVMTGQPADPLNWMVASGTCAFFLVAGFLAFAIFRRRIPYWM